MSLNRFRLITFDVTDTLLQFRASPGKLYGEIGAMFGVRCNSNELAVNFKSSWHSMNSEHPNFGQKTQLSWQNWWHRLIERTFAQSGVKLSDDRMIKFADQLIEVYKTSVSWQHCYGSIELLNYLKAQQSNDVNSQNIKGNALFALGIISNFDPRLDVLLANMKIKDYFDFTLNSYDCQYEKPAKEIFQIAIEKSKIVNLKPAECLHIGDTPITDYLGAKNAGWHTALIHEKGPKYLIDKYGGQINENHCFLSLFDFHKKLASNAIAW